MKTVRPLVLAVVACLLAGCAHIKYNPSYIRSAGINTTARYQGKLLIYTTPKEDSFVYKGRPKSATGILWRLHVPLGEYTKGAANEVYGHLFEFGYEDVASVGASSATQLTVVAHP